MPAMSFGCLIFLSVMSNALKPSSAYESTGLPFRKTSALPPGFHCAAKWNHCPAGSLTFVDFGNFRSVASRTTMFITPLERFQ